MRTTGFLFVLALLVGCASADFIHDCISYQVNETTLQYNEIESKLNSNILSFKEAIQSLKLITTSAGRLILKCAQTGILPQKQMTGGSCINVAGDQGDAISLFTADAKLNYNKCTQTAHTKYNQRGKEVQKLYSSKEITMSVFTQYMNEAMSDLQRELEACKELLSAAVLN